MKRIYTSVEVAWTGTGHEVRLDGRPLRTPARRRLSLPTEALARAVAREWDAQRDIVRPAEMPLTQVANTGIDRVAPEREAVVEHVAAYGETDLLCYRAAKPASLAQRQAELWQPLLDWLATAHDARLDVVVEAVAPRPQPALALSAIRAAVARQDDWRLTALHLATAASGSVVIGLALVERRIDAALAFSAGQLEEDYQIERWGLDAEADRRRRSVRADLEAAETMLDLLVEA